MEISSEETNIQNHGHLEEESLINIWHLNNPKTEKYYCIKNQILGANFSWIYNHSSITDNHKDDKYTDASYYSHCFIQRPEDGYYSHVNSPMTDMVVEVLEEIINNNKSSIPINSSKHFWTRLNANTTHPSTGIQFTTPHVDHGFEHYNLILYLNDCDGETIVEGENIVPEEDKVVIFKGKHHMKLPSSGRRVILVGTIITERD